MLKRNFCPFSHDSFRFFHRLARKIYKFNIPFFLVYHILIPCTVFILCQTQTHCLTTLIRLINSLFQFIPIKFHLNRQTCSDIDNLLFGAGFQIEEMELLRYCQRIYRISFSCSHHSNTPFRMVLYFYCSISQFPQ